MAPTGNAQRTGGERFRAAAAGVAEHGQVGAAARAQVGACAGFAAQGAARRKQPPGEGVEGVVATGHGLQCAAAGCRGRQPFLSAASTFAVSLPGP